MFFFYMNYGLSEKVKLHKNINVWNRLSYKNRGYIWKRKIYLEVIWLRNRSRSPLFLCGKLINNIIARKTILKIFFFLSFLLENLLNLCPWGEARHIPSTTINDYSCVLLISRSKNFYALTSESVFQIIIWIHHHL